MVDRATFDKYFAAEIRGRFDRIIYPPAASAVCSISRSHCSALLEAAREIYTSLEPSNILVITTGIFRTAPSAHELGIPSVLLQHRQAVESLSPFRLVHPTHVISDLSALPDLLKGKSLQAEKYDQPKFRRLSLLIEPFYYCNAYLTVPSYGNLIVQ